MVIDYYKIMKMNGIPSKGVIHIGAHYGLEYKEYEKCGFERVIFIEANPEVFNKLKKISSDKIQLELINMAISDQNGFSDFYITQTPNAGGDQSSSLLKLKKHKVLYPTIKHSKTINVETIKLDDLMIRNGYDSKNYNMLNIDIQGAELMALKVGINTLKNIDIINTEVNKSELYENCVLMDELSNFLDKEGFKLVEENYKYSSEWGDAVFIRK